MLVYYVCIVALLVASEVDAKFPRYINACSLSDPNFNECISKKGNFALPNLLKGVPELGIPPILNFKPGTLDLDANENLHFHSENGSTENSGYVIFDASYNPETKILKFVLRTGHNVWNIDFIANGTILDKPILEKGNAKMIIENADILYEAKLESKTIEKVKHYQIAKQLKADTTIEKFEFETIDQESVNEPMTNEQRKIFDSSLPQLKSAMTAKISQLGGPLITHVLNSVFKLVSEDELFLP